MSFDFIEFEEHIRIKDGKINIRTFTASGKDGDYYVVISPSLLVSGYGSSASEAEKSFKHNMREFCTDILNLSTEKRNTYLKSLGFKKEKFKTKNFSKTYVDENGVLQGLDQKTIKT